MNNFTSTPKTDLHVHLRGAMSRDLLVSQMDKYPPEIILDRINPKFYKMFSSASNVRQLLTAKQWPEKIDNLFNYSGFSDFAAAFVWSGLFFRNAHDFEKLLNDSINNLKKDGIVYGEIIFSPIEYEINGIQLETQLEIISKVVLPEGIKINFIVDLVRNIGPQRCIELLTRINNSRPENIVGITLGGDEVKYPASDFIELYMFAKSNNYNLSIHAGEQDGHLSVRNAINLLGAKRIGHGVRGIENLETLQLIVDKQIPLEVCVSSNVCLGIYKSINEHPIRRLFDAGAFITINSDDPMFFDSKLSDEYKLCSTIFSKSELDSIRLNGFKAAFKA